MYVLKLANPSKLMLELREHLFLIQFGPKIKDLSRVLQHCLSYMKTTGPKCCFPMPKGLTVAHIQLQLQIKMAKMKLKFLYWLLDLPVHLLDH